jgi:hypothetical protein
MTSKALIVLSAVALTLSVTGLAFAQQPTQPAPTLQQHTERGTGTGMTNPASTEGKPITAYGQPTVERLTGTGMTNPITPDGKPITTSTSLGQR